MLKSTFKRIATGTCDKLITTHPSIHSSYGSPHHNRSQSVKTPRGSGRPNQLSLPQQRSRVASMPNTGVEEEYYRLRHFSITGKGVINRGDSLKSRRSRSNTSVASSNSRWGLIEWVSVWCFSPLLFFKKILQTNKQMYFCSSSSAMNI